MNRLNLSQRRLLYALTSVAVILVGYFAVIAYYNVNSRQCPPSAIPREQDEQNALAFGEAFSSGNWTVMSADSGLNYGILWNNADLKALGHLDYLRYNCGLTQTDLDNYGFEVSLSGYESWNQTSQCEAEGVRLREFDAVSGRQNYHIRYWLKPINETRLAAFHLAFPTDQPDELDNYAAQIFPDLSACVN